MQMTGFMSGSLVTHRIVCKNYLDPLLYGIDGLAKPLEPHVFDVNANIQPASQKDVEFVTAQGGYTESEKMYVVRINERNKQVYSERFIAKPNSTSASLRTVCSTQNTVCQDPNQNLERSELRASRIVVTLNGVLSTLRVVYADNREHRVYCKAIAVLEGGV